MLTPVSFDVCIEGHRDIFIETWQRAKGNSRNPAAAPCAALPCSIFWQDASKELKISKVQ